MSARDDAARQVFAALADPTRGAVLRVVGQRGPITATAIAADLPVTRQAVVKHLAALEAAGLVEATRHGREVRFAIRPAALDTAQRWMAGVGRAWERRLAALEERSRRARLEA